MKWTFQSPRSRASVEDNVVLAVVAGETTLDDVVTLERGLGCLVAREPAYMVQVLPVGARPPPEATRRRVAELLRTADIRLHTIWVVVEGGGFAASITRAVVTAVRVLSRTRFPYKVVASVDEAISGLSHETSIARAERARREIVRMRGELSGPGRMSAAGMPACL